MPESSRSPSTNQIPQIPEPVLLTWTPDFDEDGDVVYIAGSPPPPPPPAPSLASLPLSQQTPPPSPSPRGLRNDLEEQQWLGPASGLRPHRSSLPLSLSTAAATVASESNSRRVSSFSQVEGSASVLPALELLALSANTSTSATAVPPPVVEEVVLEIGPPPPPIRNTISHENGSMSTAGTRPQPQEYAQDYTFSPMEEDSESMLLLPAMNALDTRPIYHIKVTHDLFDPSFFVTTVRRGGRADGDVVGDFVTSPGCSPLEETVYQKNVETRIFKRLTLETRKSEWRWKLHNQADGYLRWKWDGHWTCVHITDAVMVKNKHYDLVAEFFPPEGLRSPSNPVRLARMRVHPTGQNIFDELVLSVLILERRRRMHRKGGR